MASAKYNACKRIANQADTERCAMDYAELVESDACATDIRKYLVEGEQAAIIVRMPIIYNENLAFTGIPEVANDYKVDGRNPLEWMTDHYQLRTDKASAIVNDPNDCSDDSTYISALIPRLVAVSMGNFGHRERASSSERETTTSKLAVCLEGW